MDCWPPWSGADRAAARTVGRATKAGPRRSAATCRGGLTTAAGRGAPTKAARLGCDSCPAQPAPSERDGSGCCQHRSDDHAHAVGNLMTLIASARLHRLDPEAYLRDLFRVLPHWPRECFLELCPRDWL